MSIKYNGITVETSGVRTIAGGGTNANTATGALASLGGYPASNPNGYITGIDTSNFYTRNNPSGYISGDLSTLYPRSNPSGYISGDLSLLYSSSNPSGFISGVSQFNYISGDLTGGLLSPTLSHIQGNAISAASPSAGQTLQWNGTAWVPGSIPNGGNGGGGIAYYLNFGNTTGIAPTGGLPINGLSPSQLGRNYSVGSGLVQSTNLAETGYNLICGFVTASGDPGVTDIPAGLWDFNIWANVVQSNGAANQTQFQVKTYKYNGASGTYTSLANSDDIYIYDPTTTAQYVANVTMPQTTILDTDRIYVELWAKKNVSQTRQIRFYFDSLRPSHCHTTLPSVAGNGVVKVVNGVFQSPASTIVNADVSPTAAIEVSKLSQATARILGRTTAGTGAVEELSIAGNLSLASGTLTGTGFGGSTGGEDNAILRADGTGGATLQNSELVIADSTTSTQNNVALVNNHQGQTNSSVVITPKGSGAFILGPKPDGTAVGGNARGSLAVDLQVGRTDALQVASGNFSVISGGSVNTASGTNSIVVGGTSNTASSTSSTIGGGRLNSISAGIGSVICGGQQNSISSSNSFIGGGINNTVSATRSSIIGGSQAAADRYGMQAYSVGSFSANGDAQSGRFILRCKTTTNFGVEMALDGAATYLAIPSGKVIAMTMNICGVKSDGTAVAHYVRQYAVKNVAGTSSQVYAPVTIGSDNPSGTSIELSVNDSDDTLRILIRAISFETWRWVATVDAVEISYGT